MPAEAINEAILIIASVILIGALAATAYVSISYLGGAMTASSIQGSDKLLTEVQIDYATNISSTTIAVFVQNVGNIPVFNVARSTLYFGPQNDEVPIGFGGPAPNWNTSSVTFNPGQTIQVNITSPSSLIQNAFYSVMYVTPNGISSSYTLQVA
jgi:archaeal flagellar protein FlaG